MKEFRILNIAFTILFLIILALPLLSLWIQVLPENKNTENRKLTAIPEKPTSVEELMILPSAWQAYFDDHFGGRSLLFDLNLSLKTALSSKPFKDNKLVVGKEGWYFSNFQKVIDDYRAVRPFTNRELELIKNQLLGVRDSLKAHGVEYYLLIVPNKHTVYHDKLPGYINKIGQKTRLEQLYPSLAETTINVIDIREEMKLAKDSLLLYFKTDSHWNLNGSYIGYSKIMDQVKVDFPVIQPFERRDFKISTRITNGGDIVAMMGKEKSIKDSFVDFKPKTDPGIREVEPGNYEMPQPKIFHPEQTITVFEGGKSALNVVVFKDSYGGYMQQFLNMNFNRAVYVWGHDYQLNKNIIEEEQPDLVIQIIVERYLYTLLEAAEVTDE